jgi:hypothetical protein
MTAEDLMERLREFDLLLDTDPKFPSIAGLVVGGKVQGSWWAHPQSHEVFRLSCALRDHADVLMVKLISWKVTLVHRPLWPAIVAVGAAREPWQMRGLSKEAVALLRKVDKAGTASGTGDAVRELERRLLIRAESFHTERGSHAKELETWESWARSVRLGRVKITAEEGKAQIEGAVARVNERFGALGKLPWQTLRREAFT